MMEQPLITSVTYSNSEARVTLLGIPNKSGAAASIFGALADVGVNVDMISQNQPVSANGLAELSFTVPRADIATASGALRPLAGESFAELRTLDKMGKVSIVGAGLRSHAEISAKVFSVQIGRAS